MLKQINIKELVPKEWNIEEVNNNQIKVYYINKGRGSSPKPFVLPKAVNVDKINTFSTAQLEALNRLLDGKATKKYYQVLQAHT